MRLFSVIISLLCCFGMFIITVDTAVESGSLRNTFKYHYDANSIPCSDFESELVLTYPSTYPELKPLQTKILSDATKRGYISLAEGRMMREAVKQVQAEYEKKPDPWWAAHEAKQKKEADAIKKAYGLK